LQGVRVTAAFEFERDEQVTPTISVALCSFNGAQFIAEQIESILTQDRLPDEIVLSDDASSDSTVSVVEGTLARFAVANPDRHVALRLLRNAAPLGVTRNFEQAVSAATGDFIVLSDQDDRWAPDRVSRAVETFERHPDLLLVFSDANLVDAQGVRLGESLFGALSFTARERAQIGAGDGLAALLSRNLATGATTMFRRELLDAALPFPAAWVHDEWLAAIAAAIGRVGFLPERLIDYRQHGGNVIGAEKIGLPGKFSKLREPREQRNRSLVERSAVLVDRLAQMGAAVSTADLDRARSKLAHEQARLALPAGRARRIRPVLRELSAGGYASYGRGMQDVLRDLVQPAR
jgi:GT2 family glycosyltransferase